MNTRPPLPTETVECPLCSGAGELTRAEILDRLGAKDFARVAQLSAEEAFRLLQSKHDREHQSAWSRFETELARRVAEIREQHKDELHLALSEKESLGRRVEDSLREMAELREKNHQLEADMAKVARVGKREEMDFADEARTWAGIYISEKLPRNGDFILAFRAPNGDPVEPNILIDNKDKSTVAESDIDKLVRDAKERSIPVAALVAREESQLRQVDRDSRWSRKDGIWLLRTTRQWIARDLHLLKPIFEQMQVQGFDLLERNTLLAEEVFRQAAGSQIIQNAHRIRRGQMPDIRGADPSSDFHFVERDDPEKIVATLVKLVQERIPERFRLDPIRDVQVLCPMNRGSLGVRELNTALQRVLNPVRPGESSVERFGWRFQTRDKVIQTENDYDKDMFNGDIGTIERIDSVEHEVAIRFDDRVVKYDFGELDEVSLAYAVTIHKSQGSEFPAVVIPLATQHYMLLQRNLIYTGITRGKRLLVLIGQKKALGIAVRNDGPQWRYSGLLASLLQSR